MPVKTTDPNSLRIGPRAEWLAIIRRWLAMVRWIVPVVLLALVPKCAVCVAAYLGLAVGLGVSGRELCGESTGSSGSPLYHELFLPVTLVLVSALLLAGRLLVLLRPPLSGTKPGVR